MPEVEIVEGKNTNNNEYLEGDLELDFGFDNNEDEKDEEDKDEVISQQEENIEPISEEYGHL